eukprot:GHVQ01035639.1.p1 GENE.GHVQ01035639.1~~GHVQ01035639.1.p1  ORF type:complete len:104 (+),score=25.78 GHVQ01035639.1:118-429(+)
MESGGTSQKEKEQQLAQMQLLQQVVESQQEVAKLTGMCFDRCVSNPGKSLSSGQQTCIWNCSQRYLETTHFVTRRSVDLIKAGAGGDGSLGESGGGGLDSGFM